MEMIFVGLKVQKTEGDFPYESSLRTLKRGAINTQTAVLLKKSQDSIIWHREWRRLRRKDWGKWGSLGKKFQWPAGACASEVCCTGSTRLGNRSTEWKPVCRKLVVEGRCQNVFLGFEGEAAQKDGRNWAGKRDCWITAELSKLSLLVWGFLQTASVGLLRQHLREEGKLPGARLRNQHKI